MVRRGQRGSKKTHSSTHPTPSSVSTQPFGSLRESSDPNDSLKQRGIEACPESCTECRTLFNNPNCRPVKEICGHIKCRNCFINNDDGCQQCRDTESRETDKPRKNGPVASTSRRGQEHHQDLDLMPPLLTVEEPISHHRGFGSSSKGAATAQLKELPPLLSSIDSDSHLKLNLKRKQSTDDRIITPLKIQKISSAKSRSSIPKEPDPLSRPSTSRRSSRRSSINSNSSSSSTKADSKQTASHSSSSSRSSSRFFHVDEPMEKKDSGVAKRNSRNSGGLGLLGVPENQINMPSRLSLRSTSKPARLRQSSSSLTSSNLKRKVSQQSTTQLTKSRLSNHTKADHDPSFAVIISPTTLKTSKAPLVNPSKSSARGSSSNDLSVGFSRALSSSTTSSNLDLDAESSTEASEASNSNSVDTCDSPFLKDDWWTSNSSEDKADKPEIKKKKKRSPVMIHDHITILSGDQPLYQCNVCMKKFKTKAHIKYHEFCQNGEKPFKCQECGQGFIAKSHYEYHLRTHTGERPYVCQKCGKGFNQRGKVTRHMRSHTGEKPFICQQCGRGFANAQALRSHFLIHTGERPFSCQYCSKRFTGMTNLKKHVITHTGERPFSCAHCGKSFGLKWTLDLHLRTHSTERPFACDQCSRAFSNSKDLRRHLVIHSGERPFRCYICTTSFRRKDNLDRHIKNTHNQPKEVAKKLANEAAAAYMERTTSQRNVTKHSTPGRSSQAIAGTSRSSGVRTSKRVISKRISKHAELNPADRSPTNSPVGNELAEDYVLPNGETDIPPGNLLSDTECIEPKREVDTDCEEVNEVDGLAELRTVPMSEYHRSEGLKLLELAKTNGESPDGDILKRQADKGRGDCRIETCEDVKPIVMAEHGVDNNRQNFESRNVTVTVLYEEVNEKDEFISDEPTHSTPMDQQHFTNGQTNRRNSLRDCIELKREVDTDCEEVTEVNCLELRTVPRSEYHRSEGIKLLEMAKTNGEPSHTGNPQMNHLDEHPDNDEAENIDLVLKVDHSSNSNGPQIGAEYVLLNGQTDIPHGHMTRECIQLKREVGMDCGPTILRTASMSENHKPEGENKIMELAETNGESSDKENAAEINQLEKADINNGSCEKLQGAENIELVLKVDHCSPSTSPSSIISSDTGDDYRLSNGQTDVPQRHHSSDSEFDDLADHRGMNEYHRQEGNKAQEKGKTNGESSDKENAEINKQLANAESQEDPCGKLHNGNESSHSISDAMTNELRSRNQSRNFPIIGSSSTTTTSQQPSVRFVYDNGDPLSDDEELYENSMRIVYACATATAEPAVDNGPQKVRLLYAEALGMGEPDDSGQVQLVYASATPNQSLVHAPNQNVTLSSPKIITSDNNKNAEKIQRLFAQREDQSPVPIEIQYNGNGTVMAQLVNGQPEDLSWIKSSCPTIRGGDGEHHHQSPSLLFAPNTQNQESNFSSARIDVTNHHNYAYPCSSHNMRLGSNNLYNDHGESDGLRTLAKAAETRRSTIEAEDAVTRAAAAIAAVGQEARNKRHQELKNRGGEVPFPSFVLKKVDPIPHQGPRKRYLSQLTDARK